MSCQQEEKEKVRERERKQNKTNEQNNNKETEKDAEIDIRFVIVCNHCNPHFVLHLFTHQSSCLSERSELH